MPYYILHYLFNTLFQGLISVGFIALVAFLFRENLKALIQYSAKYYFDEKLEIYKTKENKRQKAVLISNLLSEWISNPIDRKNLNQLTLEPFIWLPKETAIKLSDLLSHKQNAPNLREVVSEVRELILGVDEAIDANYIIIFPQKTDDR